MLVKCVDISGKNVHANHLQDKSVSSAAVHILV